MCIPRVCIRIYTEHVARERMDVALYDFLRLTRRTWVVPNITDFVEAASELGVVEWGRPTRG